MFCVKQKLVEVNSTTFVQKLLKKLKRDSRVSLFQKKFQLKLKNLQKTQQNKRKNRESDFFVGKINKIEYTRLMRGC